MKYIVFCTLAAGMCSAYGAATHTKQRRCDRSRRFETDLCPSRAYESLSVLSQIAQPPVQTDPVSSPESLQKEAPALVQHAPVAQKPADVGIRVLRDYTPEEVKVSRQRSLDLILSALGKQQKK